MKKSKAVTMKRTVWFVAYPTSMNVKYDMQCATPYVSNVQVLLFCSIYVYIYTYKPRCDTYARIPYEYREIEMRINRDTTSKRQGWMNSFKRDSLIKWRRWWWWIKKKKRTMHRNCSEEDASTRCQRTGHVNVERHITLTHTQTRESCVAWPLAMVRRS